MAASVFERVMYHQINDYMKNKLSKQLTGFRKNDSTQHCLSYMLEMEESFGERRTYLCNVHESFKGL